ncbi:MAG TPA: hypothetical protein P5102_05065 [Candidatus Competibacteraceae bacterium]|nr:hypothetical protein [Candidatus Competibacteraceae bacterium]HRZ05513.1 hypothetical protein [Candidatus Competibacteraceae bacterium]HSA45993.1 hypothetical protein [Candidatus Competibacteraceae bacterium]
MNMRLLISACLSLLAGSLQAAPPAVTELNLMTGREAGTCAPLSNPSGMV